MYLFNLSYSTSLTWKIILFILGRYMFCLNECSLSKIIHVYAESKEKVF